MNTRQIQTWHKQTHITWLKEDLISTFCHKDATQSPADCDIRNSTTQNRNGWFTSTEHVQYWSVDALQELLHISTRKSIVIFKGVGGVGRDVRSSYASPTACPTLVIPTFSWCTLLYTNDALKWRLRLYSRVFFWLAFKLNRKYTQSDDTGRFIMYSGITKIYYRKTVGHVFTKPVQIEGKTLKYFPQ